LGQELDMLRQARKLGLLTDAPVDLIGDTLAPADPPFKLPDSKKLDFMGHVPAFLQPIAKKFLTKVLKPIPRIHTETCVGCGKCAESCPMQIITIESKKAGIRNKKACISCFCCQEMCPVRAISVKRHIRNL
jgi:ferredoxin